MLKTTFSFLFFMLSSHAYASNNMKIEWHMLIRHDRATIKELQSATHQKMHLIRNEINIDLNMKNIEITGFIVPLEFDGIKIKEFLFVPFAGACIHTPPLPPNQMILVSLDKTINYINLNKAVTISGVIQTELNIMNVSYDDGFTDASIGYKIIGAKIKEII